MDPVHYCPTYAPFFGFAGVFAAVRLLVNGLVRMTNFHLFTRHTRWHSAVRVFNGKVQVYRHILNAFLDSFGSCIRYFQGRYWYCWYRSFQTWTRHEGTTNTAWIHYPTQLTWYLVSYSSGHEWYRCCVWLGGGCLVGWSKYVQECIVSNTWNWLMIVLVSPTSGYSLFS